METVHEEALAAAGVRADGTIDINAALRALLEGLLNAVMDEQASELGVPRNGYRERSLDTCVGRVTLRIPKLREGTYFPEDVVGRWSRTDTALASAVCDMWAAGVSTRKVEAVAADLGLESMSRSRVSRLCEGLDEEVAELRRADLSSTGGPTCGSTPPTCRAGRRARPGRWRSSPPSPAPGPRAGGSSGSSASTPSPTCRGGASCCRSGHAGSPAWARDLGRARGAGPGGARDAPRRRLAALHRPPRAQRARALPQGARGPPPSPRSRRPCRGRPGARARGVPPGVRAARRRRRARRRAARGRGAGGTAYLAFPREHRHWIRTNNVSERMNCEIKRRTRVVQVFPSAASLVRLVGAVCCDQNDAWACERNFIDSRSLEPGYEREPLPEEPGGVSIVLSTPERPESRHAEAGPCTGPLRSSPPSRQPSRYGTPSRMIA